MVVIGEAEAAAIRAENVDMATTTQCPWGIGWADIHRIQRYRQLSVWFRYNHNAPVMKIIVPVVIRMLWPVDKHIACRRVRANRYHTNIGTLLSAINHLNITSDAINPLNR